jgi:hypothetical protein
VQRGGGGRRGREVLLLLLLLLADVVGVEEAEQRVALPAQRVAQLLELRDTGLQLHAGLL